MNNFNPYLNSINMTRNISPFTVAGSSAINNVTKTGRLFSRIGGTKMSLSGILNGAQKTIGTVNQIVPLYNQVKPMLQNSKILLNVAKGLKEDRNTSLQKSFKNKRNNPIYNQNTININSSASKQEIKKEEAEENTPSKPYFI